MLEFPFEEKTLVIGDKEWRFRELSVQENDDCADMAKDSEGRINGRTMMRLTIIASSVDPKITPEMLAKMPTRVYGKIYDLVNDLQNPDTLKDGKLPEGVTDESDEGNG
jgi:hypothetical protein